MRQEVREGNLPIERCEKCGKPFTSKSEVERHKMYEHPVPVSPFEERLAAITNKKGTDPEDLHRLTSDVAIGGGGDSSDTESSTTIGRSGIRRRVPFRPFRI